MHIFMKIFIFFITNIKYHWRQDSWNENEIATISLCHYYHVYVLYIKAQHKSENAKISKIMYHKKIYNVVVFSECLGENRTSGFTKT